MYVAVGILIVIMILLVGIKFGIFIEKSLWVANSDSRECIKYKGNIYKAVKVNYDNVKEIAKNLISLGHGTFLDSLVVLSEDSLSQLGIDALYSPHNPLEFQSQLFRQDVINKQEFQESSMIMIALKNGKCFMFRNRHVNTGFIN